MNGQEDILTALVKAVAAGNLLLHDDQKNLVSRQELVQAVSANKQLGEIEVGEFIKKKLIVPVEEPAANRFHVGITFDFLELNYKLEILGFPLNTRQKIARMYYSLYWALCGDIEYEIVNFRDENGREPSHHELAYLRVINEWAVANTIGRIQDRILRFEPEGDEELQQLLAEVAENKKQLKKKASFGFQENEIAKIVKEIWLLPLRFYQGREIKAFLDITRFEPTPEERRLLWGGHFDFAICDSNSLLKLVVEYNGSGHYGQSEKEKQETESRDRAKRRICWKAAVPIFTLTSKFAFVDNYKELLKTLLFIFRMSLSNVDPQFLHDCVSEMLDNIGVEDVAASKLDLTYISELASRLDIYWIQRRADMLLALLWEAYFALGKMAELTTIMSNLRRQSSPQ